MDIIKNTKIALIIIIVAFAAHFTGLLNPVRNFTVWALSPLLGTARNATISVSGTVTNIFSLGSIVKENKDLHEKVSLLESELAQLKSQISEQEQLRAGLNLKTNTQYTLVAAQILSIDPSSINQTLIINKGGQHGLVEGQAVVNPHGALAGRITRVYENTAEVTLIADSSMRLPAEVPGKSTRGFIVGEFGLSVALVEVPQGQELEPGDQLTTTGFTPGVPQGILIGTVDAVRTREGDLFQNASVKTSVKLDDLRIIFIITGVN